MGRKSSFKVSEKRKACNDYLNGKKSTMQIASELEIHESSIRRWLTIYRYQGGTLFGNKPTNAHYSKEFKLAMVKRYLLGEGSYVELAGRFNIPSHSTLRKWVTMYNKGIDLKDYSPQSEVYVMKARKTTVEERIEIAKWCIEHQQSYKDAANHFNVPYSLIYQWVKKFLDGGPDALKYHSRGRHALSKKDLTEEERLRLELEATKLNLERAKLTIEVLKKKNEIEERLVSQEFAKRHNTKQSKN